MINLNKDFGPEACLKTFLQLLPNEKYGDMGKKAAGFLPEKLFGERAVLFTWFAYETVRLPQWAQWLFPPCIIPAWTACNEVYLPLEERVI